MVSAADTRAGNRLAEQLRKPADQLHSRSVVFRSVRIPVGSANLSLDILVEAVAGIIGFGDRGNMDVLTFDIDSTGVALSAAADTRAARGRGGDDRRRARDIDRIRVSSRTCADARAVFTNGDDRTAGDRDRAGNPCIFTAANTGAGIVQIVSGGSGSDPAAGDVDLRTVGLSAAADARAAYRHCPDIATVYTQG